MKTPDSSYIRSVDYDLATRKLTVVFQDAAKIIYSDVHPRTANAILNADSVGEKFSELVRDSHNFTVVRKAV